MQKRQQNEVRVMVLFGIIQQLMTTRQGRLFADKELTRSQFAVLNHFTHPPKRSWTVTELAEVMEMNQPGITKIVTVLLDKRLLKSGTDAVDKRKRHLEITSQGLNTCADMIQSLLPDISYLFEGWENNDLDKMKGNLERVMSWLDEHRNDIYHSTAGNSHT